MKFLKLAVAASFFLAGCSRFKPIEFKGDIPGLTAGTFMVEDAANKNLFSENILNGHFDTKQLLEFPGFYRVAFSRNDGLEPEWYEVYLVHGEYDFTGKADLSLYPAINSPSDIQKQLSDYYTLADETSSDAHQQIKLLNEKLHGKSKNDVDPNVGNQLAAAEIKENADKFKALALYINKYPQSTIGGHLLSELNYEDDPIGYYKLYQRMNAASRNNFEGKMVGDKLAHLIKLQPGAGAPAIAGKTPEGKSSIRWICTKKFTCSSFGAHLISIAGAITSKW